MGDFPYFYTPLPHDPHPLLCCSRLQEDQRPGINFQTVPKLNFLVHFLAFVLAGESLGPDESYYRSVFLIDSTHGWVIPHPKRPTSKVEKCGDLFLERNKMHVLRTFGNCEYVKLPCIVQSSQEITPIV